MLLDIEQAPKHPNLDFGTCESASSALQLRAFFEEGPRSGRIPCILRVARGLRDSHVDVPEKYRNTITNNPALQSDLDIVACVKRFASDPSMTAAPLVVLPHHLRQIPHPVPLQKSLRRSKKNEKREKWKKLADACPEKSVSVPANATESLSRTAKS